MKTSARDIFDLRAKMSIHASPTAIIDVAPNSNAPSGAGLEAMRKMMDELRKNIPGANK